MIEDKNNQYEINASKILDNISFDTIGLAMHNAITTQQQCNVTISASVANTCTRILAVKFMVTHPVCCMDKCRS
jgi:hypothetical protein